MSYLITENDYDLSNDNEIEIKYVGASSTYSFESTTTGNLLNGIASGTNDNQRIGNIVQPIKLDVNIQIQQIYYSSLTNINNPIRLLIVWDKQCNGNLPLLSDCLDTATVESLKNLNNRDRFVNIIDYTCNPLISGTINGTSTIITTKNKHFSIDLTDLKQTFGSNGSNIADIKTGSLVAFYIANEVSANSQNSCIFTWKFYYTDC